MVITQLWQEKVRDLGAGDLVKAFEEMASDIREIKKNLAELKDSAFPGGDVEGHRRYHDLMIQRNAELRSLRIAIQEKTLSGLVWAVLVFLGLCVYTALMQKLGKIS